MLAVVHDIDIQENFAGGKHAPPFLSLTAQIRPAKGHR